MEERFVARLLDGSLMTAALHADELVAQGQRERARLIAEGATRLAAARAQAEALLQQCAGPVVTPGAPVDVAGAATPALPRMEGWAANTLAHETPAAGHVVSVIGLTVRAHLPTARVGQWAWIERAAQAPVRAEIVGLSDQHAILLPLGDLVGVGADSRVVIGGAQLTLAMSNAILGRVLDGVGRPLDDGPPLQGEPWPIMRPAPSPLSRRPIRERFLCGVRALDGLCTLGKGQRVGLFAAAGVGKSTLLGQLAESDGADVIVVCLVGERGREVQELRHGPLAAVWHKVVLVCATADSSALERVRAAHTAIAIAEWFRDQRGQHALLLMDSLTRVARAQREIGLAVGEPVARHGFPPSVFALLPRLVERTGLTEVGAITAVFTVLVANDDLDEPISDEVRGLLDGHVILDRRLAERGHFPPIDIVRSVSRVMPQVVEPTHLAQARAVLARRAVYEEHRDVVTLGAYKAGQLPLLDEALRMDQADLAFARQGPRERAEWAHTCAQLAQLVKRG